MLKDNNKIQEVNLSLYQQITLKDIQEILKVKRMNQSYYILRMNRIKKISNDAAKLLSTGNFSEIEMKSLNKISNQALNYLSGMFTALKLGINSLNKEQTEILLNNKAALNLNNVRSISIQVAKILSKYEGNILELPNLKNIHPKAFEYLNQFKGDFLILGGLKQK